MTSLSDQCFDADNLLTYKIFSILESKFLLNNFPKPKSLTKTRILSIDAAADDAILAAVSLVRLENSLRKQTSNPNARVADYFDIAAGSGSGGVLAALLFAGNLTARECLRFMLKKDWTRGFNKVFGKMSMRDSGKPLLIPCYDKATGAGFMFSRSDAVEAEGYDFLIRDVLKATCGEKTVEVKSVDMKRKVKAVGGGVIMGNPAAAAVTHVLNNRREFPFAEGVEDLIVVSLGSGRDERRKKMVRIAGDGAVDMVDQSLAMAFGQDATTNYIRIQANGLITAGTKSKDTVSVAESIMSERNVVSVMFRGKTVSEKTNGEKLDTVSTQLIMEEQRRKSDSVPTVLIKTVGTTPRSSSSTVITFASSADTSGTFSL